MMKKILILNGSHSEIPLIQAAHDLGFYVITTGNLPDLPGHQFSDKYCQEDFSNKEAILELAQALKIDAICSCAHDLGILTASYVAERLQLPGHDPYHITKTIHLKSEFKKFAAKNQISTPKAVHLTDETEIPALHNLNFPLMVKPVDSGGGKGISKVANEEECRSAVNTALEYSKKKEVIVEEFFEGSMHSLTTFILKQKVVFYFCDNEYSFAYPYYISTSAAPASNFQLIRKDILSQVNKIASSLNLQDGILHFQYLQQGKSFTLVEVTRRCSGDFYPVPVEYATGVEWSKWIVRSASGMDCSSFPKNEVQKKYCGRHCIVPPSQGFFRKVVYDRKFYENYVFDSFEIISPGTFVGDCSKAKISVLFLHYPSEKIMLEVTSKINQYISVEMG